MADKMWDILRYLKNPAGGAEEGSEDVSDAKKQIDAQLVEAIERTERAIDEAVAAQSEAADDAPPELPAPEITERQMPEVIEQTSQASEPEVSVDTPDTPQNESVIDDEPPALPELPKESVPAELTEERGDPGEQADPFEEGGGNITKFDENADGRKLLNIPVEMISANPYQPRKNMDESELSELSESIRELGVLQPILVRRISPVEYELIAGERRLRAAKRANLASIPAMLMETTPLSQQVMALVENIQRKNLSAIEEAICLQDILSKTGWSQSDLAKRMGRSQASIANKLRLLRLDESVQRLVVGGKLGERQARALLSLSMEEQRRLAQKTIDDDLSTRELEDLVEKWGDSPRQPKAGKKKIISEGVQPEMMNELVSLINKYRAKGLPAKMRIKQNDAECLLVEISADFPKQII